LESLHDKVERELLEYGFEADERAYIPHLTLGRSGSKPVQISEKFESEYFVNIFARLESISLYQSRLKAEGPEYIELFSIK
jgi:2'-5' RNA ligase